MPYKPDFANATVIFKRCLEQNSTDGVVQLLISRCVEFQKIGAPESWDGTFKLTEK